MRTTGICIWLFLNVMLMGMMGYMYLLWMQYRKYIQNTSSVKEVQDTYNRDIGQPQLDFEVEQIHIRKGRPRIRPRNMDATNEAGFLFPVYDSVGDNKEPEDPPTTHKPTTTTTVSPEKLAKIVEKHKMLLTVQFRTSQMDGGNILFKHQNRYGVRYRGFKDKGTPSRERFMCALRKTKIRSLRDGDEPFTAEGMAKYFPHEGILEGKHYNTCAVVTNAGTLKDSNLGDFIDTHDAVVRFNHAPTKGNEKDVGKKTTLRIVNSQVVTKPEFDFWGSPLYRNISMIVWDPSNYTASLAEWYAAPDFPVFNEYFKRRLMIPHEVLHLLHPGSHWRLWDTMQKFTHTHVLPNPPSSGFLGLIVMLHHCQMVRIMEFIPSTRFAKRCHYWDPATDVGCTFGDWHPLSTEKLLTMLMNVGDDVSTFVKGYVTIPGFSQIHCPSENGPG